MAILQSCIQRNVWPERVSIRPQVLTSLFHLRASVRSVVVLFIGFFSSCLLNIGYGSSAKLLMHLFQNL